ncbi:MAG: AraC family transcriptional regulator [Cellulophaga sp.]|uniref:AraC family transcriptional regulator n=1 Tax=unclassified Cellulophaga TaxID=2634405 RepID=UPI000C2BA634|nr:MULTISPECIES: AraC family transcriptional regulator [unclassified Cellulophaga]MDO6491895.1 AraC family transcriptional regulator [Cellulophaga sp. 2_MG-2023]MDO6495450.1 AraC family transcriptional regulator [Cellulophaga sp. 3_MG-2023]PKB43239.1 AraC-like DNA-binding protein [Cellulophaga sp. RHA19]
MKNFNKIEQYHLHKAYPNKLQFQVYDLKEYRKKNPEKAAIPHSHSYYQIIWFFNEGGTHTIDFKTYDIKENSVLFTNKDQIHSFDDNLEVEGWLIHFNESFFMHSDVDIFLKYTIFNVEQNSCYHIDKETAEIAEHHIKLIQKELPKELKFGHEDTVRFLLKSLLINLERVHHLNDDKKLRINNTYERQLFNFKDLIEVNYNKGLSITAYADILNISSRTLTSITKTLLGKSPSQLLKERIILEAKRLLKFTSLQSNEIAFRLGFEDDSYFVKYFKKSVGILPSAYRSGIK